MIRVYYAKVFSFLEEDAFFTQLNKVEDQRRQKILSGTNEKKRLCSLSAGCLLHSVLCRKLGLSEQKTPPFRLAYENWGKPYLLDYPDIHFNLSHSGDYVCCALGDAPVGIDIQKIVSIKEGLAGRFFTEMDNQRLEKCNEGEKEKLFFRMWSIKESYVKLTGRGLSEGLNAFEIDWEKNRIVVPAAEAYFEEWGGLREYCMCVCMEKSFVLPKPIKVLL